MTVHRKLLQHHRKRFDERGITDAVRIARGCYSTADAQHLVDLGYKPYQALVPALVLPSFNIHRQLVEHFIRPDSPRINAEGKPVKYDRPIGSQNFLDVNPINQERIWDTSVPIFFTEGIFKADTLTSLGYLGVSLQGTWNFCTRDGPSKGVIPELREIPFGKRLTYIVFDSDIQVKEGVYHAAIELGKVLRSREAIVKYVIVPPATHE